MYPHYKNIVLRIQSYKNFRFSCLNIFNFSDHAPLDSHADIGLPLNTYENSSLDIVADNHKFYIFATVKFSEVG